VDFDIFVREFNTAEVVYTLLDAGFLSSNPALLGVYCHFGVYTIQGQPSSVDLTVTDACEAHQDANLPIQLRVRPPWRTLGMGSIGIEWPEISRLR
jgi:hypothetical protein